MATGKLDAKLAVLTGGSWNFNPEDCFEASSFISPQARAREMHKIGGLSFQLDFCQVFQPTWCQLLRQRSSSGAYERVAVARFSNVTWLFSYSRNSLPLSSSRFKAS